jgi:hypothetical protein
MLLLAGRAAGTAFGPDSFQERVEWATEGSPPNLVAIIARVARQTIRRSATPVRTIHSPPVPLTPEIAERIRMSRQAALQRLNGSSPFGPSQALSSLVPTSPSPAKFSPVSLVSTPSQATTARSTPTTVPRAPSHQQQQQQETNRDEAAAIAISRAIGQLPQVVISEQEWENAGRVRKAMFAASCCSSCALPTCKPFGINLHPQKAGAMRRNSKMLLLKVMKMQLSDFNRVFARGWSPAILHELANWLAQTPQP